MKKIIFILSLCCIFWSCRYNVFELSETEELSVQLPFWPAENSGYPRLSRWKIQITSASQTSSYYSTDELLCVSVKKNEPLAISAYPITLTSEGDETDFFKPAGMVYPYEQNLSWEGGFSSYIFQKLFRSKKETGVTTEHMNGFLQSFNWKKLTDTIKKNLELSETSFSDGNTKSPVFYNPWQIDMYQLFDNLCFGNFKPAFVETKNIYSIPLEKLDYYLDNVTVLSSFIPENKVIQQYKKISVKKDSIESFSYNTNYSVVITYISSKKISQELVNMPIFKDEI